MSDHNQTNMNDPQNGRPEGDKLDALLSAWHAANADRARAGRDRLLAALSSPETDQSAPETDQPHGSPAVRVHERTRSAHAPRPHSKLWIRRFLMNRYSPVAAALIAVLVIGVMLLPNPSVATAQVTTVMAPDGGRLDALDKDGNTLGPCTLKQTAVHAEVSGCLLRVNVKQVYANPYSDKIETVYTFPLSHKGAVDRMTMTIGSRVVQGEVKERELARQMYEAARDAGRIASLLEQQRPNIFTQSVANIEPKAEIVIEISYVELLEPVNGQYSFVFPTTVGPRYIPGGGSLELAQPRTDAGVVTYPSGINPRRGLVLAAPGKISMLPNSPKGTLTPEFLQRALNTGAGGGGGGGRGGGGGGGATPVRPDTTYAEPETIATFRADYPDGSAEYGSIRSDGVGEVAGRWFYVDLKAHASVDHSGAINPGSPFSTPAAQVPDADKITPMPVRPPMRAGHDISISVSLDTGGPGLSSISSPSHTLAGGGAQGAVRATVELAKAGEIPNKDFVLNWSTAGSGIQEGVFTHTGDHGSFFSVILEPPARIESDQIVPRELYFVLDTSGSMNGWPMEKSKELMRKAIGQMRPSDTFNVITFAGATDILWKTSKPASEANIAEAQAFVGGKNGGGGTEMMKAINAALEQKPGSGRVRPLRTVVFLTDAFVGNDVGIIDAIKKNRGTTRVFSLGVGNSVNRYLIDGMAKAGGGESEVVLLDQDADSAVARLTRRIQSPVLTDIKLEFSGNFAVTDVLPADENGHLPDLYDLRPLVLTGRYTIPGSGTLTIRGNTGAGPYERTINVTLPPLAQGSDAIATLWARAKVDEVTGQDLKGLQEGNFQPQLKAQVVQLGETFQIMTPFTSFVAVDKLSVTVNGKPRLVHIPIELPAGSAWEGFFGGLRAGQSKDDDAIEAEFESGEKRRVQVGVSVKRMKADRSLLKEKGKAVSAGLRVAGKPGDSAPALRGTTGDAASTRPQPGAVPTTAPAGPGGTGGGATVSGAPASTGENQRVPARAERRSDAKPANAPAPTAAPASPASPPPPSPAAEPARFTGGTAAGQTGQDAGAKRESQSKGKDQSTGFARNELDQVKKLALDAENRRAGMPQDYNGGSNSVPPAFQEIYSIDEPTQQQFVALLKANPLTPSQLKLLGIAPELSAEDQIATGRVPTVVVLRAGAMATDPGAMKAAIAVLGAMNPGDPAVQELSEIAALAEKKDAGATNRAKKLADDTAARIEHLFRELKLVQTVDRELLENVRRLSVDKTPASAEVGVVVLVSNADKATLEAVKSAGLKIDYAETEQRVLIGRVQLNQLEDMALLESVRRVEPDR